MAKRERFSSVDTAWLRMDRPTNLMMIVGVMMFDDSIDIDRLKRVIETRVCHYPRFRQRVVIEATGAYWEDDERFDIDAHVKRVALRSHGGRVELQNMVAKLATTPLDPARPLWQFLLVENYGRGCAMIGRIHHCIADGIALMGVLLSMTDESPDAARPVAEASENDGEEDGADVFQQLLAPLAGAVSGALEMSGTLWQKSRALLSNPGQVLDYARIAGSATVELVQLATMPDDTPTRFKGKPGTAKRVAWSDPMPLAEIKTVGKALGCSVNDILLSSVSGALREYLVRKGDPVDGVELRALVPVNLRSPDAEEKLGNRFGLVALVLPVGIEHPIKRLYTVKLRMDELKSSYQAPVTLGLLGAAGLLPRQVQQQVLDYLADKATAVMTNVPGPQKPLYLAGARMAQIMVWVPQSGDIGLGVSILSYNGAVQFGLITDRKFVPDPATIVDQFRPEFEKIVYTLLMAPWEEARQAVMADRLDVAAKPSAATRPAKSRVRGKTPRKTKAKVKIDPR